MPRKTNSPRRVGIYSGTFDPVHAGHVGFALQAMQAARLDRVYFLPERRPRSKAGVEHFGHRVAMLKRAARPHRDLRVLELEDVSFSVERTIPRLQQRFPKDQLVLLVGSDVARSIPTWPNADRLLRTAELVIGMRSEDSLGEVELALMELMRGARGYTVIESYAAEVSSRRIREALRQRRPEAGLLRSVERYSDRNWLYISLA